LIRDPITTTLLPMIVLARHKILVSLILVWICSSGLQLIAESDAGFQLCFKADQNRDLDQKAIAELGNSQKSDTVRRDPAHGISFSLYSSHARFVPVQSPPVRPNGPVVNRASSRALHQKISLYLI
jgi:hypothetical protein